MVELYFKHLYPSTREWRERPFTPWEFKEHVLLSVLSFFESNLLTEEFNLSKELGCKIMMDSGAFAATAMGFTLDAFEVAEMQAILKADLIVPLDLVILEEDTEKIAKEKIEETIENTKILLDFKPKNSEIIGPLQGFNREIMEYSFNAFRELGIRKFALGGIVFQPEIDANLKRIQIARDITSDFSLHIFGKFLHPELLELLIKTDADSVDGYGYIISSIKGLYIKDGRYQPLAELTEEQLTECSCPACQNASYQDFTRGDRETQHLIIEHNIHSISALKNKLLQEKKENQKGD